VLIEAWLGRLQQNKNNYKNHPARNLICYQKNMSADGNLYSIENRVAQKWTSNFHFQKISCCQNGERCTPNEKVAGAN
jgi:hypothetical protein